MTDYGQTLFLGALGGFAALFIMFLLLLVVLLCNSCIRAYWARKLLHQQRWDDFGPRGF